MSDILKRIENFQSGRKIGDPIWSMLDVIKHDALEMQENIDQLRDGLDNIYRMCLDVDQDNWSSSAAIPEIKKVALALLPNRVKSAEHVTRLRQIMSDMKPEERLDLTNSILSGYCHACGLSIPDGICHCNNDE